MDHETISRKDKIEMARRMVGNSRGGRYYGRCRETGDNVSASSGSLFFLRFLFSFFLFLSVLAVTEFHAMGEEKAAEYQKKIEHVLVSQRGIEKIKQEIDRLLQ